jgi:hypothetical protein
MSTNTKKTKKTRPICLLIQKKRQRKPDRYVYQYKQGDIGGVKDDMKEYSDKFLKSNPQNNTVEENWTNFKVTLIEAMKKHIPQKKISSRWNLPWITTEIKRLIRKKRRAYNAGKKKKNGHSWRRYLKLNQLVNNSLETAHRNYVDKIKENPKRFDGYIKHNKSGTKFFDNIPVLKPHTKILSEPTEKAEALSNQYTSVFTKEPTGNLPNIEGKQETPMSDFEFTSNGTEKLLSDLNPPKASGPDLLPTRILKLVASKIAPVLSVIFQQSYDTGTVPTDWTQANITAVFKKGDKTKPSNYRSVSLTCIICKTMEDILFSQIMKHLDQKNILVKFQHCFRANHSCETQLLNTVEDLFRRLDMRTATDLLILDFSKAFNTVPHRRLLSKLNHYGIGGKTKKWMESWLCHRNQKVVLDGSSSQDSPVLYGVPQGTVLGPLMFLLYANDIGDKTSPQTSIKLFADDFFLYRIIKTREDEEQLQADLNMMIEWSNTWLMSFNADKCHLLKITRHRTYIETSYHIEGKKLSQVPNHPYLGVELTSDLTWIIHTSNITGKANKILNLLRRHLYNCSTEVKSRAFTSLVRPHLEYASSVWDPYLKQDINQLEKVQRKGARFVCGKYQYTKSVTSMLAELDWQPLQKKKKKPQIDQFLQCHKPTYTSYNS